ncbi:MAG: monovalent cation/H(+) antiporter subunit G [Desulfobulbaceae bacterium]|nr:monovalent cation/H(+) antiporter subunit G [Desulfobulbaceae bacterium]
MLDFIVIVLLSAGILFFFGTINGLLRFPDFYTRMHAAGKGDTLSTVLILLGLALYSFHHPSVQDLLTGYKIIFIAVLIAIASPTATHALMDAGYESGIKPWGGETDSEEEVDK